jgi:amino acid transporter
MKEKADQTEPSMAGRILRKIIGKPRDIHDPSLFHKLSLVPLLAWIGLGADGLSSSSYGPEEAFKALGQHTYLAFFIGIATALTVLIIAYAYSRIIEHFPTGGGGYVVATQMLGPSVGVVSGSALIVDYVLTIAVSITSSADALFSYLPVEYQKYKIFFAALLIIALIVLNIRGIKESVTVLAPIFIVFILTHAVLLIYGIASHLGDIGPVALNTGTQISLDLKAIGFTGLALIFLRAYSLGGGTFTGIEAVSNGLQIMRDPKVKTGKRTMLYMALSLSLTAGGLFCCYLLANIGPVAGKTLNTVLAQSLFGSWGSAGTILAFITILSEGALLIVGAQAGFIDAPRVMANMAVDSWLPKRFSDYSERISMRNGILLIGIASLIILFITRGSISTLVVMYSINVFITFSLSNLGMAVYNIRNRKTERKWKKNLAVHLVGLVICLTILLITIFEKFREGGWLTLVITGILILICLLIRQRYRYVQKHVKKLDDLFLALPETRSKGIEKKPLDKGKMTAIQLVSGYNGFGVHTFLSIARAFPGLYKNVVFVSVGVIDQHFFKEDEKLADLKKSVKGPLKKYVDLARSMGMEADMRMEIGTNLIETATDLCIGVHNEFPNSTVFTGKLLFKIERFYHKLLYNETAFEIQRRLHWKGITNVILPIRMQL